MDYYRQPNGLLYYSDMSGVGPLFYPPLDSVGRVSALYRWDYGSSCGLVTAFGYDPVSRPASIAHQFPGGGGNATTTFGYNPASQIATQTRDNDAYAWTGAVSVPPRLWPSAISELVRYQCRRPNLASLKTFTPPIRRGPRTCRNPPASSC